MRNIGLLERLNIYIKSLRQYVLGFVLYFLLLTTYSYFAHITDRKIADYSGLEGFILYLFLVILVVVPFYLIGKVHLSIGRSLFKNTKKEILLTIPVFVVWTVLLIFKFYVNEIIYTHYGGYGGFGRGVSEVQRLFNYFLFSLWTTILWWEIYYRILLVFQRNKPISVK
ncbi:hypothetical protein ACMA1I_07085 [Pontibacter sp. 13R65]|uniref:hypothetical protein n=1 Tax=Pontibacter sp. 13R65 TaxID=3127458 RepID=UPI00301B7729